MDGVARGSDLGPAVEDAARAPWVPLAVPGAVAVLEEATEPVGVDDVGVAA